MHSSRKTTKTRRKPPDWPSHSQLGNPYPPGLEPVVLEDGACGANDVEREWAKSPFAPGPSHDYLHEQPDPKWPRLKLRLAPRDPQETDEQYDIYRRDFEAFTCTHALWLGLCQQLCTHLGNHRTCAEGACRRVGACAGIRDQDRYPLSLLVYPPCVPLDREIMETCRAEILAELRRICARAGKT